MIFFSIKVIYKKVILGPSRLLKLNTEYFQPKKVHYLLMQGCVAFYAEDKGKNRIFLLRNYRETFSTEVLQLLIKSEF